MITLTSKLSVREWVKPITYQWSKVSGPGTVTFGTPTAPVTTAAFDVAGDYVIRCAATDGTFSIHDDTSVLAAD